MPRAFLLVAAALGVLAGAAARADADSVGTFQANVTVTYQFSGIECPAGTTTTTVCFSVLPHRTNTVAGLGEVSIAATTAVWENFRAPCGRFSFRLPVVVKDKGEIDLAVAVSGCWTSDDFPPAAATVTGGSGRYAGASGDGTLVFHHANISGPLAGLRDVTWTGTLVVPETSFDTTPPTISGTTAKVVKTKAAGGAQVRYTVTATDAVDGAVSAACLPKSGSRFPVGRTTVTCNPTDSSGNAATTRFLITVKRVR